MVRFLVFGFWFLVFWFWFVVVDFFVSTKLSSLSFPTLIRRTSLFSCSSHSCSFIFLGLVVIFIDFALPYKKQ